MSSPNVNQRRWSRVSQLIWPYVKPPPTLQITSNSYSLHISSWMVGDEYINHSRYIGNFDFDKFHSKLPGISTSICPAPNGFFGEWLYIYTAILIGRLPCVSYPASR